LVTIFVAMLWKSQIRSQSHFLRLVRTHEQFRNPSCTKLVTA
jgi:hypothetical protein